MAENTKDREIIVAKVLDAPRDLVFAAWTERKHMEKWWLPTGARTDKISVKPGGVWRYSQPGRNGLMFPYIVKFVEIDKPKRLVIDFRPDLENAPDSRNTVTFEEEDGKTKVTMHLVFASVVEYKNALKYGAIVGARMALENLADYIESKG